tara:strand:+ start:3561 stop:3812 length:252 start_codon:yes stop_codon:yes gene_type:complete
MSGSEEMVFEGKCEYFDDCGYMKDLKKSNGGKMNKEITYIERTTEGKKAYDIAVLKSRNLVYNPEGREERRETPKGTLLDEVA